MNHPRRCCNSFFSEEEEPTWSSLTVDFGVNSSSDSIVPLQNDHVAESVLPERLSRRQSSDS